MRVLHLNSMLTGGGTDDQCVKLAAGLRGLGVDAEIFAPPGRELSNKIAELEIPLIPGPPGRPSLKFILSAARIIRQQRSQIVHGHHGRDIWPTVLAARLSGIKPKIVLTRHMAKSPSSWPSRKFLLSQVDALIAVSDFVKKVLIEGVYEPDSPEAERRSRPPLEGQHSKICRIYGGIDTRRFRPLNAEKMRQEWGLSPGNFAFGVVGGYDLPRGKGQREFLQAAARISKQIPEARFLIIGRGNMAEILDGDIAALNLEGRAWRTGFCSDMPSAMNALDCLVHPQVGTEALGLVVCEAHACGKPVIASDLDGIPEAFRIGNYGLLVKPESIDQLADAMLKVVGFAPLDLMERQKLHEKVDREFSLEVAAKNVKGLYEKLWQS